MEDGKINKYKQICEELIEAMNVYLSGQSSDASENTLLGEYYQHVSEFINEKEAFVIATSSKLYAKFFEVYGLLERFEPYLADSYDEYIDEIGLRKGVEKLYVELLELFQPA